MDNLQKLREQNIKQTKEKVKQSVTDDLLIIQAINHIDDLNKVINILAKDLREWYGYNNPEVSRKIKEHSELVEAILEKTDKKSKDSMGADLSKENFKPLIDLCTEIKSLFKLKGIQETYIESMMNQVCPNISIITGPLLGAQLLQHAGSLRKIAIMPSSTVQLLGAEEALFRHIKTGARCPKYGLLHNHPLVTKAKREDGGKVARIIAGKISIAAKVDYMKGNFVGDKLLKEIEEKLK